MNLFKLMAYKDEYEVARLFTDGRFMAKLQQQFGGDFQLRFHLAPPLIAERDPLSGELRKREYGPWVFRAMRLIAGLRRLRGGPWDIFGRTEERRTERRLITEYEATLEEVMAGLDHDNHAMAVRIAELPDRLRGFGHVKEANIKAAKAAEAQMLERFRAPAERPAAAE